MKAVLFLLAISFSSGAVFAQQSPTIKIATDKDIYFPGDSLHWQCALLGFGKNFNTVTVQLWIEQLRNGARWEYRFPVINGYAEGAMRVGADIPPGRYAFNFLLQADFFNISGKLNRPLPKDSILNYFVLFKDRETTIDRVNVEPDGSFSILGLVYPDTAMFSFSKPGKRQDAPSVRIVTSLDSAFRPVLPAVTKFISIVGAGKDSNTAADIKLAGEYHFDIRSGANAQQLAEIVVKDKRSNKLLKEYEEAFVTAQFRTADDITLDGLSNDDMEKASDIYNYLMMHVPGLTTSNNPETGVQEIKWRNATLSVYVDEFQLPEGMPLAVSPGEVALIKVYRQGSGPLTGGNSSAGAIAIYTKVGPFSRYLPASARSNRFYIRGYDGRSIEWRR